MNNKPPKACKFAGAVVEGLYLTGGLLLLVLSNAGITASMGSVNGVG